MRRDAGPERRRWMRLLDALESAPKGSRPFLALAGVLAIGALGFVDYRTGYELASSLFYLLPIAFLTWAIGRRTGIAASVLAAAVWMTADAGAGHVYSYSAILFWNTALRLGFFLATTLLLAALKDSLRQERRLSQLDPLTGAANGRRFLEILQAESERSGRYQRPFTLVYLDVDDFKQVNDRYGHNAGDAVLRCVAAVARSHLRTTDTVARLGGDEFALLLPETGRKAARAALTKLRSTLNERTLQEGPAVTFSMGALTCRGTACGPDALLTLADKLMYRVKREGKDNAVFDLMGDA